jgi:hypothetical protein
MLCEKASLLLFSKGLVIVVLILVGNIGKNVIIIP